MWFPVNKIQAYIKQQISRIKNMGLIYRNRFIFNQRGGSIDITNTTEREKIQISQRSGSNISLTNVVNSELATNNKQLKVLNDLFETVGRDKSEFVQRNVTLRTGENTYNLKGFVKEEELTSFKDWKDAYKSIADLNSQFKILRGGVEAVPNGQKTPLGGNRKLNPVIDKSVVFSVENKFAGYTGETPIRLHDRDDVVTYKTVIDFDKTSPAETRELDEKNITKSAGPDGSDAPAVKEFGAKYSCATEDGSWSPNNEAQKIGKKIVDLQETLNPIEEKMGNGGDEISFIKRHKYEQVGATFNDYPSIRIDDKGRSQPSEILISDKGTFLNHDYASHIEEIDNSSIFPCGNDDKIIGNRYTRTVGSGGVGMKTTGTMELGSTLFKVGSKEIHLNANHGIKIGSEDYIDIQSMKTISLRTNRQVYIGGGVGINGNTTIAGGLYVEGELYCQHITAPIEVHETQDTIVASRFATDEDRKLLIGEAHVGDLFYPVYAIVRDDIIISYPHSHHHNGIPMRLTTANKDVRGFAHEEGMNSYDSLVQSFPQQHRRVKEEEVPPEE